MANRLRGRAGVEQRKRRLAAEPICRHCIDRGIIEPSTVPDHIIPLVQGGLDIDANIRCLCDRCHKVVTAEQFGQQRRAGLAACDRDGMPTDPAHPWARANASQPRSFGSDRILSDTNMVEPRA